MQKGTYMPYEFTLSPCVKKRDYSVSMKVGTSSFLFYKKKKKKNGSIQNYNLDCKTLYNPAFGKLGHKNMLASLRGNISNKIFTVRL